MEPRLDAATWARTRALVERVADAPADAREAIYASEPIDAIRAEARALVAAMDDPLVDAAFAAPLADAALALVADAPADSEDAFVGARIADFTLLRRIGSGGAGLVFEAIQRAPERRVAVKILRRDALGPAGVDRFEREAAFLARLDHPSIARVLASGIVDREAPVRSGLAGRPWIAMEFVDGASVTAFVARRRLGRDAVLALVVRLCEAVEHAHRRGVLHRDLSPANILVDEGGTPRILDFGIARPLDPTMATLAEAAGDVVGTLGSMSPEQIRGGEPLDERADVYALGALAHRLLAGRPAFDLGGLSVPAAIRAVLEREPEPLASIDPSLGGDVELVVATAMAKDRERRYRSAEAFAADLRALREHRPVAARAPTALYRARRFVDRHRVLVAATTLAFLLVSSAAVWAFAARAAAERSAEATRRVNAALVGLLDTLDPVKAGGPKADLIATLDEAERLVDRLGADADPPIVHSLHDVLGERYFAVGLFEKAVAHHEQAVQCATGLDARAQAATHAKLGNAYRRREAPGDAARAVAEQREALRIRRDVLRAQPLELAECRNNLGAALVHAGAVDEGLAELGAAIELASSDPACPPKHLATSHMNHGVALLKAGRMDDAIGAFDAALRQHRRGGGDPLDEARMAAAAGAGLLHAGRPADALPHFENAWSIRSRLLPLEHDDRRRALTNLVMALVGAGRPLDAEPLAVEAYRSALGVGGSAAPEARWLVGQVERALEAGGAPDAAARLRAATTNADG
jgi:tetratricopeptide (TPR) repeat protein